MKQYFINLATLNSPRDICHIGQYHDTKNYCYGFWLNGGRCLDHGKANDKEWESGSFLNRAYRKSGGFPGWVWPLDCSSAKKQRAKLERLAPDVNRSDIILAIYDWTSDLAGKDEKYIDNFLLNYEHKLRQDHINVWGEKPVLMEQNTKAHPSAQDKFEEMFE